MTNFACIILHSCLIQLVFSLDSCVTRSVYYVSSRTGADSEDCLRPDQRDHPCASLSYLKDNIHQCATMKIMDDLLLNNTVLLFNSSWTNISIIGNNNMKQKVSIHCEGNSGLYLNSSVGFFLESLHFVRCLFDSSSFSNHTYENLHHASVMVDNSENVHFDKCSFSSHCGSGLLLIDVIKNFTITNNIFLGLNLANENGSRAGGIVIRMSSTKSNTSINIISSNFTNNYNRNESSNECADEIGVCHNFNECGGAIDVVRSGGNLQYNLSVLIYNCLFHNNSAIGGGAVSILISTYTFVSIVHSRFISNKALCRGGAVLFELSSHVSEDDNNLMFIGNPNRLIVMGCRFISNNAFWGGAVAAVTTCTTCHTVVVNLTDSYWADNSASSSGFAIWYKGPYTHTGKGYPQYLIDGEFSGCKFENNWPTGDGSGVVTAENAVFGCLSSRLNFTNNSGTALVMRNSAGVIGCRTVFKGNSGTIGGAIYIEGNSYIDLGSKTEFTDNTASVFGGAVYSKALGCTFEIDNEHTSANFSNNYAGGIEQSIYLESTGGCWIWKNKNIIEVFNFLPQSETQVLFPLYNISLSLETESPQLMLGEDFYLKLQNRTDIFGRTAVGIGYLRIHSVKGENMSESYKLLGPKTISLDNHTERIKFLIFGPEVNVKKKLIVELYYERHEPYGLAMIDTEIYLFPCRLGYIYSTDNKTCVCADQTMEYIQCLHGLNLQLKRHFWYSVLYEEVYPCPSQNCLYIDKYCPHIEEYCPHNSQNCLNFTYCNIHNPDDVCKEGRSGFLCSSCHSNYSFTLAGVNCTPNSSCKTGNTVLLLIVLFAYWTFLVIIILLGVFYNLSVGSGYMYGAVYFFSVASIYTRSSEIFGKVWIQVTVYIASALAALDNTVFGYINICFSEHWESPLYHETFRLATPIFISLSVFFLILLWRRCPVRRYLSPPENYAIKTTCLLLFFCHTSVAQTSINLLIPISVNGSLKVQLDPNLTYFGKAHLPFAVTAIFAELFYSIPLAFLLLFFPLISKCVNTSKSTLKLIVQEFQACFKPGYCWFSGLYFVAKQMIYLLNGIKMGPFPHNNNILTTLNILVLLLHSVLQPYSKKWLNILDTVLLTDILVLSLSSPLTTSVTDSTNQFFYYTLIPYCLILIPIFSFLCVIVFTFLRKWTSRHRWSNASTDSKIKKFFRKYGFFQHAKSTRPSKPMAEHASDNIEHFRSIQRKPSSHHTLKLDECTEN